MQDKRYLDDLMKQKLFRFHHLSIDGIDNETVANIFSLLHSHERIFAADIFTLHGIPHRYRVHNVRRGKMSLYDLVAAWVEKNLSRKAIAKSLLPYPT
jgi:hypothetical protein